LNSRERIRAAIHHQQPDRVPLDLGGTEVTGIAASAYARLRQALGLPQRPPKIGEPYQMLAEVEDDVRCRLGIDTVPLKLPVTIFGFRNEGWKPWQLFDGTQVLVPRQFITREAENGDLLLFPGGDTSAPPSARMPRGGYYFDAIIRQQPFDEISLDPEEWVRDNCSLYTDEDLRYLEAQAKQLYHSTDWSIVCVFGGGEFGEISSVPAVNVPQPKGIRDPMDWYMAHIAHPEYIKGIFELQCEIGLRNAELLWQAVGSKVDVVYVSGTDLGTQQGAFLSPSMYREFYKPFHKRLNDWIHQHTSWKTFYHTCGSIVDLLDDLVESGVDILNPVQCSARGMDPVFLKETYGDRLVFWGGGVDTQWTLPFGTPAQVYEQVRERVRVFGRGGGFVFNPVHNIQQNVPVENMLAMFEALERL
jgi:hypothetical protein